ncbi:MAG: deoxyribose-phosphate aldolase [Candidatus Lloydbacteria bacterium RIFCSPHIGHO2_01_FULL_49_22]|uniref:Deoxyribose-phosphate aldolase n=1 Tax=Candidatus Lloydbacteria bacterium RIFCSPHIGHO2_01_FULL_49_22 TaxID=1798658 RepID=A0A1G2CZ16_9BACT|nr:MAG: deoxyribose-phosphate aldolase [Candidatus Lloydbacteria bacterium RIFCSPHIGHO2_01_FULL_49_22]OGZ09073.1 MAG: deoxyribose-phosphate aldolase [Candidatus Lloydbacteria bacterium RIFCSPHIGHO2_02_FULL_50_18]
MKNIASYIDHTLLKPDATPDQITKLCEEARQYHFASVCINPSYVAPAVTLLCGSGVKVCTVIGFPLGATSTPAKFFEANVALEDGATEIDVVIHVGRLCAGNIAYVESEIRLLAALVHSYEGSILKVIIETCLLSDDEKILACQIAKRAGADFVKTSTGFSSHGATVKDVELMRHTVGPVMGVKASGGISTYVDAKAMIDAGATRIGTSKGVAIVNGAPTIP